ncbi:carbohydrate porin [Vibrio sp. FNV 38]|nr:carbohydrate porin [Vibrio sp. FNV 38]
MKNFKVLPLTIAVASSLAAMSAFAATDADVAALEARIAELETRATTPSINVQEQNVLPADFEAPLGIIFSGYARYGAHYKAGDERYVQVGSTGAAVGRLGNEANGGEVQLAKVFDADNGAKWDVVFMVDDWNNDHWGSAGGVNLKKMYAGVTNFVDSQPDLYVWGGRDFHQRPQQGINDYFWMSHDGQGAGFNNLNLGGVMLDMGFVGQVGSNDGSALGNDTGRYAITSKLHGINAGIGQLDIYANYGFASDDANYEYQDDNDVTVIAKVEDETAWQIGATLGLGSSNKLIAKYADGADDSVFELAGDKQVLYVSLEGNYAASDQFIIDYLASYKDVSGDDVAKDKNEYSVIARPQYQWNDVHSTWLEAGYAVEDFDEGGEKDGWKVTLSQNISMGGLPWSRPMVRLYATVGEVTDEDNTTRDTTSIGAMFEAWW